MFAGQILMYALVAAGAFAARHWLWPSSEPNKAAPANPEPQARPASPAHPILDATLAALDPGPKDPLEHLAIVEFRQLLGSMSRETIRELVKQVVLPIKAIGPTSVPLEKAA